MPTITPYTERYSAEGSLNVRNDGSAAAQIGNAVQGMGEAAMGVAEKLKQVDDNNGKLWAAKQASDLQLRATQELLKRSQTADPRDPDFKNFATDFTNEVDAQGAALVQSAPNRAAQKYLGMHLGELRNHLYRNAASTQASLFGEYTKELAQQGISADSELVAADSSNDNFDTVLKRRIDTIRGMETDGLTKLRLENDANNKLGRTQVLAAASSQPKAFLVSVGLRGGVVTSTGPKGGVPTQAPTGQMVDAGQPTLPTDDFGRAASAIGLTGPSAALARSIYGQESQYGKIDTSRPNYAGANGPMQVTRETFDGLKKQGAIPAGADFNNPKDTMNAGLVLIGQLSKQYGGDPAKIAAAYYAGPQAVRADGSINTALRDLKNPKAPTVGQYVASVVGRIGPTDPGKEVSSAPMAYVEPATEGEILASKPAMQGWQYLTPDQKIQMVRMAEGLIAKENAGQRAEIERGMKDRMAMMADGKVPPDMDDPRYSRSNLVNVFGADVGNRARDAWEYQSKVGAAIANVNTMTPAQIQATAAAMAPTGPDGYADKARTFAAFTQAAAQVDNFRQKNPMDWGVRVGLNGAGELDFSDPAAFTEGLKKRAVAAVNLAQNYGTQPEILKTGEPEKFAQLLDRLAPKDKISMLESTRLAFGNDTQGQSLFRVLTNQVSEKTPMVSMAANLTQKQGMVNAGGVAQSANTVAEYVLEGEYILRGKKLDDPNQTSRPTAFDDKVLRTTFNTALGNAFRNLDGQTGARAQTEMYQAVKNYLAADLYHRGTDLKLANGEDVNRAIQAVTGGVWRRNGDHLMAPWGTSMQKFQDEFDVRAQAAIDGGGLKGTQMDLLSAYSFDNVGDGKYAFRTGGKYLVGTDGRAVVVDYNKPLPYTPQAETNWAKNLPWGY